ncbi:MAG: FAD-dependent oxidoreductase [Candidatus Muiribacteriaceae bacterium]
MSHRLVVIGANAAGLSAAMEAVRKQKNVDITVIDRSEYISYGACAMPYLLSGKVEDHHSLFARRPEDFDKAGIDLRIKEEVKELDINTKKVSTDKRDYTFDSLVIATGASPVILPFEDPGHKNVFHFTRLEHALAVKRYMQENRIRNAVIVGGGYIGLELADVLCGMGIHTALADMQNIIPAFDNDVLAPLYENMKKEDKLRLYENSTVRGFNAEGDKVVSVNINDGDVPADMVIVAAGLRPNTELARNAGIRLGKSKAIQVNTKMQTSSYNVFAGGDCAEIYSSVTDDFIYMPLGTHANRAGKIIGRNISVASEEVKILGSSMLKVFGLEIGGTGVTEKMAEKYNMNVETRYHRFALKPRYISKENIYIKFVVDKYTRHLLGAQLIGDSGIHGKVNNIATMIYNKMKVEDIEKIDMGYHPLLSGVWDPLILMGRKMD